MSGLTSYYLLAKLVMGLSRKSGMEYFLLNFRFIRLQWKDKFIYQLTNMLDSSIQGYPANIPFLSFR